MNRKITPFVENIAESTAACLITMVQGNILAFTLSHWLIASQTGLLAGSIAAVAVIAAQTHKRWVISVVLGVTTAIVDYFVHPGGFGPVIMEAIVTGVAASLLSYVIGSAYRYWHRTHSTAG